MDDRVIIKIRGGVVQEILSNNCDVEVVIVDYDDKEVYYHTLDEIITWEETYAIPEEIEIEFKQDKKEPL